jgi:hypothetical protein
MGGIRQNESTRVPQSLEAMTLQKGKGTATFSAGSGQ